MDDPHQLTLEEAHRLIKRADILALRHALDSGLDPDLANRFSWTLLMLTAIEGNRPIGELLLARGAHLHATNDFGETAISLAAHGGHEPFVQLLLQNGAATDCKLMAGGSPTGSIRPPGYDHVKSSACSACSGFDRLPQSCNSAFGH